MFGPREHAVGGCVGVDDGADTQRRDALREVGGAYPRGLDPAFHLHPAVAGINAHGDTLAAMAFDKPRQRLVVVQCPRADNHTRHAGINHALHVGIGTHTAADLHRNLECRHNAGNHIGMRRCALEGAVEVNDMQRLCAERLPVERHGDRIIAVNRGLVGPSLAQPHAAAFLEVDSGKDRHVRWFPSRRGCRSRAGRARQPCAARGRGP